MAHIEDVFKVNGDDINVKCEGVNKDLLYNDELHWQYMWWAYAVQFQLSTLLLFLICYFDCWCARKKDVLDK